MKFLRAVIFFLLGLLLTILLIALFADKGYEVERRCSINKSRSEVFDYLVLLRNHDQFSTWARMDPEATKTFRGTDGAVGFVATWDSENPNVGKGEQEIVKIMPPSRIDYELRFVEPYQSTSPAFIELYATNANTTEVVWGFKGEMDYPINIVLLFFDMEVMVGNDLEEGLQNLKQILEK